MEKLEKLSELEMKEVKGGSTCALYPCDFLGLLSQGSPYSCTLCSAKPGQPVPHY